MLVLYHHAARSPGVMVHCCNSPRGKELVGCWANESNPHQSQQVLLREPVSPAHGMEGQYLINIMGNSASLFGFALPNARGGGKAAVKGLLKGLGGVKTTVQRSALQIGSFKGMKITMAEHIPGRASYSSQS